MMLAIFVGDYFLGELLKVGLVKCAVGFLVYAKGLCPPKRLWDILCGVLSILSSKQWSIIII
jgi:hypothetical protein